MGIRVKSIVLFTWAATLATILCAPAPMALAVIPGADNLKGFTRHDYCKAALDFNRRTLGEAYDKVGRRDDRWNKQAKAFLESVAVYFSYKDEEPVYQDLKALTAAELAQQGQATIDAGCDDPLVQYCLAVAYIDVKKTDLALVYVRKAVNGIGETNYHPLRKYSASKRALDMGGAEVAKVAEALFTKSLAEVVDKSAIEKALDRRVLYSILWSDLEHGQKHDGGKAMIEAMSAQKDPGPWLMAMLAGQRHINAAWEARGGGWASTVTEEGWKIFHAQIAEARQQFESALALEPDYPEAAAGLITISMAGGTPNTTSREWFDQSVEAQVDYDAAYVALLQDLLPRWGGSHEAMYAFAVECLQTDRYDTNVPTRFLTTIEWITGDQGSLRFWQNRGVYANAQTLFAKAKEKWPPHMADWYSSYHVCVAVYLAKYDDAKQVVEELGDRLDKELLGSHGLLPDRTISQIYAYTGPNAEEFQSAQRKITLRKTDAALAAYTALIAKLPKDDKSLYYAQSCKAELETIKTFNAGKWMDLQPDADLGGWTVVRGKWKVEEDGTITGTADAQGQGLLVFNGNFPPQLEAKVTIEHDPHADRIGECGLVVNYTFPTNFTGVAAATSGPWAAINTGLQYWKSYKAATIDSLNDISAQLFEGQFHADINDQPVATQAIEGVSNEGHVGLYMQFAAPGATGQFTGFKVRKLTEKPEGMGEITPDKEE